MAARPWWWAPLITVFGTPLLGAQLYFFVPLLRVAKLLAYPRAQLVGVGGRSSCDL